MRLNCHLHLEVHSGYSEVADALIKAPILVPALVAAGVDLVWFGVIVVILMEAALISPPEGINLYVIHGIRKSVMEEAGGESGTIMDLWLGVLPFMLGQAIVIFLLVLFPGLALWLPNLVKGLQ
jgi:C4-dicarboxylate transporter DctM subunit